MTTFLFYEINDEKRVSMKCTKCGTELKEGARFCRICGEEVTDFSEAPVKPKMPKSKRIIITLIVIILILALATVGVFFFMNKTPKLKEGKAFKTEEDAYVYFIDKLSESDYLGALEAFGAGRKAAEFDLGAYIDRIGAWNMTLPYVSSSNNANIAYNEAVINASALNSIKFFVLGFVSDEEKNLNSGQSIIVDNSDTRNMLLSTDVSVLEGLKVLDIKEVSSYSQSYASKDARDHDKKSAEYLGGNTIREYVALLKNANGSKYISSFGVIEYEDGYFLQSLNSIYLGISDYGNVVPLGDRSIDTLEEINVLDEIENAYWNQ